MAVTPPDYFNYTPDWDETENYTACNRSSAYYVGKGDTLEFVLKCIVLPVIVIIGLVGNTLSYLVLHQERKQRSVNFILKILAIADNLLLIFMILFLTLPTAYAYNGTFLWYQIFWQTLGRSLVIFLKWASKTASIYLTLFVTAERYIAISRPLKAAGICTLSNARRGCVAITLFTIVYNAPKLCYYKMFNNGYDPCMDKVMPIAERTALYAGSAIFVKFYVISLYFIIVYIIPLLSLFVLNYLLIRLLRQSYKQRAKMGMQKKSSDKSTEKIVGIVTAFIVLETPAIIVNLMLSLKPVGTITQDDLTANNMIYILSAINSVINFYIYCVVGKEFRGRLVQLLMCKKKTLASRNSTSAYSVTSHGPNPGDRSPRLEKANGTVNVKKNPSPKMAKISEESNGHYDNAVSLTDEVTHL